MKVRLGGLPHEAPHVPCVTLADVEAVVSAWTGIPPERMGQDDRDRLSVMEPVLKASLLVLPHLAAVSSPVQVHGEATGVLCLAVPEAPAVQLSVADLPKDRDTPAGSGYQASGAQ